MGKKNTRLLPFHSKTVPLHYKIHRSAYKTGAVRTSLLSRVFSGEHWLCLSTLCISETWVNLDYILCSYNCKMSRQQPRWVWVVVFFLQLLQSYQVSFLTLAALRAGVTRSITFKRVCFCSAVAGARAGRRTTNLSHLPSPVPTPSYGAAAVKSCCSTIRHKRSSGGRCWRQWSS